MATTQENTDVNELKARLAALDKAQAVIEFDLDGYILDANENFLAVTGYSLGEIRGKHHRMFCDPAYAQGPEYAAFWQRLNSGEFDSGEYQRFGKGGKEVWILASYNPMFDENGKPYKVVKYASDITEARARAAAAGKRNTDAMNAAATNLMICDADFNVVYANDKTIETLTGLADVVQAEFGLRVDEIVGGSIDRFHKNPAHQRGMLQRMGTENFQGNIAVGDRTLDLNVSALHDEYGNFAGAVVNWEDITEALALQNEAKRSADAMDAAATNLMICDADFNLVYANQRTIETLSGLANVVQTEFGVMVQDLVGGSIDRFHQNPAHQRNVLKNLGSRKHEQNIEVGDRTLSLSVAALHDTEGEFAGSVVNWEDITDKLKQEADERAAAEELRRKVDQILGVVNHAAQGDLTNEITVLGEDPIGQMGEGLQSMIKELSNIIVQIQEASDQFGNSAKSISDASNNLAESSQTQAATVEEMSASVGELTGSIDVIAKNARDANEVANNTVKEAEEGGKAVDRSIQAMKEINQSSEQISEIIQVISEIASQTNLLALNAAIEAARAGEHGLGFAVVADEVRKLAERSSEAAKQITGLIRESTQRVADGAKLSEQTGAALKQIIDGVDRTAKAIAEIASATDEQSATAGEVSRGIQNVSSITENNSASSEEMASSSEQLAAQAVAMRELVRHFQI